MTNTRRRPDFVAESSRQMPVGMSRARRRRKSLREEFCHGLRAGLKAEPEAFAGTKPRTMLGLMVRNLVCAAADARCDAIKLVVAYVSETELTESDTEAADDNSQGISGADTADDTRWDWDENGWDSSEREKKPGELDAERAARTEAMREDLLDRFIRAADAVKENEERAARLAAERGNQPPPNPPNAQFSGNFDPHKPTIRIGGKLVEG